MISSDASKSFASVAASAKGGSGLIGDTGFKTRQRPDAIRNSNIVAAKAVADAVRTSLGPRGMDKMIQQLLDQEDEYVAKRPNRKLMMLKKLFFINLLLNLMQSKHFVVKIYYH
ncbi:unnamed protein product [Rotaria sp. Silwood1]|nr:unnamed protein product [Rotaria sp. Silwood1]